MNENEALHELKHGSEDALAWFIHKYTPYICAVINNIIGEHMDIADIEEVAAEVFYEFWKNAQSIHSVKGFLGTVARNKAKNKLRELTYDYSLEDYIHLPGGPDLSVLTEKKELSHVVNQAVLSMSLPDREIFLRYYYYYQKLEEISREMNIPLSTVKSKLRRGREQLKQILSQYLA